ncbi:MAG: hypothetical protein IJ592_04680, partial [Candidatus Methanomethylophilaceae archaeon]|nr:hypothetical protein [Candidatus Methanomethylophilaceae archaeon]
MDERIVALSEEIIDAVKTGKVRDRDELQNLKLKLSKKYDLGQVPRSSDILANVAEEDRELL